MVQNKAVIFKKVPSGMPVPGQDLAIEDIGFDTDASPPSGGATARINYVSFDPYQRGRMRGPDVPSYSPPFTLGKPITNRSIATILSSDNAKFKKDDVIIVDQLDIAEYAVLDKEMADGARVLENPYNLDPKVFIGALGMPGLTAFSSLHEIGEPKKGETIFISAASGAVGQLVGQIAKHEGLRVIGSVGDDKKLEYITTELGFEGFNYKSEKPAAALKRLAPKGIDIYYENVGGEHLEAAINAMNPFGRIVACGMISQYNAKPGELYGVPNLMLVVGKRLKMQGFIVSDANMGPKYMERFLKQVPEWIHKGEYKPRMSVTNGIDNAIEGLLGLFSGKNFGKAVCEIAPLK